MNRMPTTSPQAHASSERTDAEAALLEGLAFERLLADLSACFADVFTCDFPTKIEQSLSQVVAFLGYDRCTFAELVAGHYLDVLCSAAADGFDPLPRGRLPYQLPWFFGELRAGGSCRWPACRKTCQRVRARRRCTARKWACVRTCRFHSVSADE